MEASEFKVLGKLVDDWMETRFEHRTTTKKIQETCMAMGLEKEYASDITACICFIRGYMACAKKNRGQIMP